MGYGKTPFFHHQNYFYLTEFFTITDWFNFMKKPWATYDQVKTSDKGDKSYSHEVRMLEKIAGSWKIVAECVFHYDPDRKD